MKAIWKSYENRLRYQRIASKIFSMLKLLLQAIAITSNVCQGLYAMPSARVIFKAKTSLDIFREHIPTTDLGDDICGMKRMTESGQQGITM